MNSYKITFTDKISGESSSLELVSKFTCIYGKDSGEGKSEFFSRVEDGINTDSISIDSELPFTLADDATLAAILNTVDRSIILIDEFSFVRSSLVKIINKSKHLFIVISRTLPLKGNFSMSGIYRIRRTDNWFQFEHFESLPLLHDLNRDI